MNMNKQVKTKEKNEGRDLIRFDWAMKRLLRNKADYVVLEGFLTVLLGENVKITGIGEGEGNRSKAEEKSNRVDILVENDAKEIFIIEIQNCREMDYLSRMLFGVSKAITDHMKIGQKYTHVRKVYHINIVYFELGQGEDYVYHGTTSFRGIHHGDELQLTPDAQEFFGKKTIPALYPEYYILKVEDFNDYAKDSLDEWIYYFKNDVILDTFTAPGLCEAKERLRVETLSPADRAAYDAHLMALSHEYSIMQTARTDGRAEGREEGRAEGEEERKKLQESLAQKDEALAQKDEVLAQKDEALAQKDEVLAQKDEALAKKDSMIANAIKNLIQQGMSPQQVAQILQLDVEEVRKHC
jgi:predicted transposase/invertase (TIGR01784 family)